MKTSNPIRQFVGAGWIAGVAATLVLGLVWPIFLPGINRPRHYYGFGPNLLQIILIAMVLGTPGGLIGGLFGWRIPREGGRNEQFLMSGVMGILLSLPFSCYALWFFTGF